MLQIIEILYKPLNHFVNHCVTLKINESRWKLLSYLKNIETCCKLLSYIENYCVTIFIVTSTMYDQSIEKKCLVLPVMLQTIQSSWPATLYTVVVACWLNVANYLSDIANYLSSTSNYLSITPIDIKSTNTIIHSTTGS